MKTKITFLILFLLNTNSVFSQTLDSLATKSALKKSILPTSLITAGALINHSTLEKNWKIYLRNKVGNDFEFRVDDYIQYVPIGEMYLADLFNVKTKNHWFDQTKHLLISNLITSSITEAIKHITLKTRPNGGNYSFPSGHTTFAFTNATVLYNEYKQTVPVLAYSGYLLSTGTGAFRMINNKHWLSDVLVGAGIGIIVTNWVYYFEPLKNFNPFHKSQNISLVPQFYNNSYGVYFSYSF